MQQERTESGRTLLETLAVLVVIAILIIAGIFGYNFVIHQYRKQETVKQIGELAVRYKLRPITASDGEVNIKDVYPEAERASTVQMKTADNGRVSLHVEDTSAFSVIVNNILDDSCEAQLEKGDWESVFVKSGLEEFNEKKEDGYLVIGRDLFENWNKMDWSNTDDKIVNKIPDNLKMILQQNPLYIYITSVRCIVLDGQCPSLYLIGMCTIWAVGMFIFGSLIFKKNQDKYIYYVAFFNFLMLYISFVILNYCYSVI